MSCKPPKEPSALNKFDMWTIGSVLKWTQDYFEKKGIDTPRLDAEVLLADVLGCERIYLYVNFDKPLEKDELARYRKMVEKRARRFSVAHIIGKKEFMGLTFKVTEATLVPRPDTEILVGAAAERLKKIGNAPHIADIGTGTGAIGLSLCRLMSEVTAVLTDISDAALAVAEENAANLNVADKCRFFLGDLTAPLAGQNFTAIIANPPYIADEQLSGIAPEVQREPITALAGGKDGLDFYRRLANDAPPLITPGGFMAVEVGIGETASVAELFTAASNMEKTAEIIKDLAGIERVVIAWKQQ